MAIATPEIPPAFGSKCSASSSDIASATDKIVSRVVDSPGAGLLLVGPARRAELTRVAGDCLESMFGQGNDRSDLACLALLDNAVGVWAREGIPLHTMLRAAHAGIRCWVELVVRRHEARGRRTRTRETGHGAGVTIVVELLDRVTSAISVAYTREVGSSETALRNSAQMLVEALRSGGISAAMARESGVRLAENYAVLALHLASDRECVDGDVGSRAVERSVVHKLRAGLAFRCGEQTPALLSARGGTVFLAADDVEGVDLDDLVADLSLVAGRAILAAVDTVERAAVPRAVDEVHLLLDTVIRFGYGAGLYRLDRMALEVQLCRPGPGRDSLAAVLAPLEKVPDLLELLCAYYDCGAKRRVVAERIGVHVNTIDNRLKSIARITGVDPVSGNGAWILQSALVAAGHGPMNALRHR